MLKIKNGIIFSLFLTYNLFDIFGLSILVIGQRLNYNRLIYCMEHMLF